MIVCVLAVYLKDVVVHVLRRQFHLDGIKPEGFKFQHGYGSCGILKEGLVNLNADLFSDNKLPFNQVVFYNFLSQVLCHTFFPS